MQVSVLGPLVVTDGAELEVPLPAGRGRALLALLALRRGGLLRADEAVEMLWPEGAPPTAGKALQNLVVRLRRALPAGDSIRTEATGYRLTLPPGRLDADLMERLCATGQAALSEGGLATAEQALVQGLELWRGDPWTELPDLPAARADAVRLRELRDFAEADLVDVRLELGQHAAAVGALEQQLAADPLRERAWGQLMLALYRCGRQADALAAYQRARRALAEELGIDPGPELRRLESAVLAQDPSLDVRAKATVRASTGRGLPTRPAYVLGRERELQRLEALVRSRRVVTIVGGGGLGKTTLALEVAHRLTQVPGVGDRSLTAACFVDLAVLASGDGVLPAVAAAAGTPPVGSAEELSEALAARSDLLLVVDNAEHVLDATAAVVQALRAHSSGPHVLVTSREPLRHPDEALVRLEPLAVPDAGAESSDSPSVELLRRGAVDAGVDLEPADLAALGEVARLLDGIPLALHLAATRLAMETPRELAADLAAGGLGLAARPGGEARHATMRSAVLWSYDLLDPAEQRAFRWLSVVAAGAPRPLAEALTDDGAADDTLAALVRRSLLTAAPGRSGTVFRLLVPVRQVAADLLARQPQEEERARRAHAEACAELAERHLAAGDVADLLDLTPDVSAAFTWAVQADLPTAARLFRAVATAWVNNGRAGVVAFWGRHLLDRAVARPGALTDLARGVTQVATAMACWTLADWPQAERMSTEALALAESLGEPALLAEATAEAGTCLLGRQGEPREPGYAARAQELLERSVALWPTVPDGRGALGRSGLQARCNLGILARAVGDPATGVAQLRICLAEARAVDDPDEQMLLGALGAMELAVGDLQGAMEHFVQALEVAPGRRRNDQTLYALFGVAEVHRWRQDTELAFVTYRRLVELTVRWHESALLPVFVLGAGLTLIQRADLAAAVRALAVGTALRGLDAPPVALGGPLYQQAVDRLRADIGDAGFAQAWAEGAAGGLRGVLVDLGLARDLVATAGGRRTPV